MEVIFFSNSISHKNMEKIRRSIIKNLPLIWRKSEKTELEIFSLPDLHSLKDQSDQEDVEITPGLRIEQLH